MDLKLKNKNCVVLGGSRGIGRSIALGFAAEGTNVAICARGEEALKKAEGELLDAGVKTYSTSCDIADPAALKLFLEAVKEEFGSVDILVHNASALAVGPDIEDWKASLDVDLMGAVHSCETVIPWMTEAGGGAILLVSSTSGLESDPMPDYGYTAAKAALIAYAKKLAVMLATQGIKEHQPEMYEMAKSSIPSGRLGTPEEVADAAVFLCSPRAQWITGECVSVDGAQHKGMR